MDRRRKCGTQDASEFPSAGGPISRIIGRPGQRISVEFFNLGPPPLNRTISPIYRKRWHLPPRHLFKCGRIWSVGKAEKKHPTEIMLLSLPIHDLRYVVRPTKKVRDPNLNSSLGLPSVHGEERFRSVLGSAMYKCIQQQDHRSAGAMLRGV